MSKAHSTATKAPKTTVKPSAVLDLSSRDVLDKVFLLQDALWRDGYMQAGHLFDAPETKQDIARIVRETLGIPATGIETLRIRPWQVEELYAETRLVIHGGGGIRYAWIYPVWEWIKNYADRPLLWPQYFAVYAAVSGEAGYETMEMIYPWDCLAILEEEECDKAVKAGRPGDINKLFELLRP